MMRSFRFTRALPAIIAALALAPALRADDEPPLFPETPEASQPSPSPSPAAPSPSPAAPGTSPAAPGTSPAAPGTPAAVPGAPATALKPAGPVVPLRKTLDFTRWQEMTARERQTYAEGMTQALGSLTARIRQEIGGDGRMSPEALAAVVKFIDANYPKRPTAVYLKEMESIYLTTDGQKLPMLDCFLQAFRRANGS